MFTSKTTITDPETIKKLAKLGSEWQKADKHRIYFNNLEELYGLDVSRYGTGNVSSATLDGEKISNGEAKRILSKLYGKLYFDYADGRFHSFEIDPDVCGTLVEELKTRLMADIPEPVTINFSISTASN